MSEPSHGTEVGVTFSFVEVERMYVAPPPAPPRSWLKTIEANAEKKKRVPITDKWIYAFRVGDSGGRARLFAEYGADAKGNLSALPGDKRLKFEPAHCPAGFQTGPLVSLPPTANGQPNYWFFVVSRIRLACASLRELCRFVPTPREYDGFVFAERNGVPLLVVDLSKALGEKNSPFVEPASGKLPALPVPDFLTIAYKLHAEYELAAEKHMVYVAGPENATKEQHEAIVQRAMKYTLARAIHQMIQGQPSLLNQVEGYGEQVVMKVLNDFDNKLKTLKTERERTARRLVDLLRSPLVELVESWYRDREDDVYDQWLDHLARLQDRLDEAVTGVAHFRKPSGINNHSLAHYIFPSGSLKKSPDAKKYVSSAKKVLGPITNLWGKFLPWYLVPKEVRETAKAAAVARKETVDYLNGLFGEETLTLRWIKKKPLPKDAKFDEEKLAAAGLSAEEIAVVEVEATRVTKGLKAAQEAQKKLETAAKKKLWGDVGLNLQKGADTLNNAWKLAALSGKDLYKWTRYDVADGVSGVNGILKTLVWERMKDRGTEAEKLLGEKLIRRAALVGIVCDAFSTYKDVTEAIDDGDIMAAVSSGAAGIGAIGGGALVLLGVVNPALAFVLLTLQGAGTLGALRYRNDRFENFVSRCIFGNGRDGHDAHPKWCDGSYKSWTDDRGGLERQITTLYNLITTFHAKLYKLDAVAIRLNVSDPDMELVARYYDDTLTPGDFVEVVVELRDGQYKAGNSRDHITSVKVHADRAKGHGPVDRLIIEFDRRYLEHQRKWAACVLLVRRRTPIADEVLVTTIPPHPVGLDDHERDEHGPIAGLDPPGAGMTFVMLGNGQANFREKDSLG